MGVRLIPASNALVRGPNKIGQVNFKCVCDTQERVNRRITHLALNVTYHLLRKPGTDGEFGHGKSLALALSRKESCKV